MRKGWQLILPMLMIVIIALGGTITPVVGQGLPTLRILVHQRPRIELVRQMVPMFEAIMMQRGRPVKVEIVEGPAPDPEYQTKLFVDLRAGTGADAFMVRNTFLPSAVEARYLLDLTDRLTAWRDWSTQFYPVLRNQVAVGGRIYSVPPGASVMLLFYRRDILQSLGISTAQPKTFDDLLNRAREIRQKSGKFAVLYPAGAQWGGGTFSEGFLLLMLGTKSPLYNGATGRWVVRSPGLLTVFKIYETLAKERLLPVDPLLAPQPWVPTKYRMFTAGDLLITTSGTWAWDFDWGPNGAAPLPGLFEKVATWELPGETEPYVLSIVSWSWAVNAASRQPDLAWEWVKFATSARGAAMWSGTIGAIAARRDAKIYAAYATKPHLIAQERSLLRGKFLHPASGIDRIAFFAAQATDGIITGRMTADQALDFFAREVTAALGTQAVESLPMR